MRRIERGAEPLRLGDLEQADGVGKAPLLPLHAQLGLLGLVGLEILILGITVDRLEAGALAQALDVVGIQ